MTRWMQGWSQTLHGPSSWTISRARVVSRPRRAWSAPSKHTTARLRLPNKLATTCLIQLRPLLSYLRWATMTRSTCSWPAIKKSQGADRRRNACQLSTVSKTCGSSNLHLWIKAVESNYSGTCAISMSSFSLKTRRQKAGWFRSMSSIRSFFKGENLTSEFGPL